MARFEINCPRCEETLAFRAQDGDVRNCAVCDLEFEIDGEPLYDPQEARHKPKEFVCPACCEERVVYASNGDEFECACGQDLWVEAGRVWYADLSPVTATRVRRRQTSTTATEEKKALALARTLEPADPNEAAGVADQALAYLGAVGGSAGQQLKVFLLRIGLAAKMVKDAARGRADVPWGSVAALAGALAYFAFPQDVIPDWLPAVGFMDDAAVVALTLKLVNNDVAAYARAKRISLKKYDL